MYRFCRCLIIIGHGLIILCHCLIIIGQGLIILCHCLNHHLQLVVAGCLNILVCCEGSSTGNEKVHVHVVVDTVANIHVVAIRVVLIVVIVVVVVVLVGIVDNVGGHCGGNNAGGEVAPD